MKIKSLLLTLVVIVAGIQFAAAQTTVITATASGTYGIQNPNNAGVYSYNTSYASGIGEYYAPGSQVDIITFQLPTISGGAYTFTGANLYNELYGYTGAVPSANGDLYVLGLSVAPVYDGATQFYTGPSDPNVSHILIQAGYLTPTSGNGTPGSGNQDPIYSSTAGSIALANYLNTVDANNAAAGQYVTLRINYTITPTNYEGYNLLTSGAGGATEKPTLTLDYSPIPEPSTYALMSLGGFGLLFMRRRLRFA